MSVRIKSEQPSNDEVSADVVMSRANGGPDPTSSTGAGYHAMDEDVDDEEDEIVREIDVFLSPELSKQLHMIQFPLQHDSMPAPTSARIRPRHCMLELEYRTPEDIQYFGQFSMPTRTYSSHTIPISTHLALGRMVPPSSDNENMPAGLHLVPLSRILQMRPSFHHVDEAAMNATATTAAEVMELERQQQQSKEMKQVGFQKKESERAELQRKSSYSYKKASEDSEIWIPLEVYDTDGPKADDTLNKIVCKNPGDNLLVFPEGHGEEDKTMNEQYMQSLNYLPLSYKPKEILNDGADALSKVVVRLVDMMSQGWPMPFSILRTQFPASTTNETLFKALGTCALFIRGNFIIHSKYLPLTTHVAEARTFILFILQTLEIIHRDRLEYVFAQNGEVPSEALLMLLNQVAQKTSEGWKLKVEDDASFAERHPDAIMVFLDFWVRQVQRFGPFLQLYRTAPSPR